MGNSARTRGNRATRHRRRAAVLTGSAALALFACTRILGIDGKYVLDERHASPARVDAGSGAFEETGGGAGSGGAGGGNSIGAGGRPNAVGSGGVLGAPNESGGSPVSAGAPGGTGGTEAPSAETGGSCTSCPPAVLTACTAGTYTGKQRGTHAPSVTFVGVPLPVTGTLTFTLAPNDAGTTAAIVGTIDGDVSLLGTNAQAPFTATLEGTVDCATGNLAGTLQGSFSLTPGAAPFIEFAGTHYGTFANGAFTGTWSEHETQITTMPNPYVGKGTWSAAYTGP